MITIIDGGLENEKVVALLRLHFDTNIAITPPGSAHVFDVSRLKSPDVNFWSAWEDEVLLGVGALKQMDATRGEIKSMHTSKDARRKGVGSALLLHIMAHARNANLQTLFLETGSFDYFAPARALYARHGFVECAAFEGYKPDPYSTFMTRKV